MAAAIFDRTRRVTATMRRLSVVAGLAAVLAAPALAFDYARYEEADLDDLLAQPRPRTGLDVNDAKPLRLKVMLVSYDEACATGSIMVAMRVLGFPKEQVDGLQASRCIKVRSAKGKETLLFIQDVVRAFLPREIPIGNPMIVYAIHLFTAPERPGLLVNEFQVPKSDAPAAAKREMNAPCGCGTPEFHPGVDMTAEKEGAPVSAMDDGVVLRVEQDEAATIDVFGIDHCGRYVVVKHSHPNGHVVFTRYAQLGRIVGAGGRPIAVGATIRKNDKIGEVGPSKTLHFEIRPVAPGSLKTDATWQSRYGDDPSMDWSRYEPVDPQTFDADAFGGRTSKR